MKEEHNPMTLTDKPTPLWQADPSYTGQIKIGNITYSLLLTLNAFKKEDSQPDFFLDFIIPEQDKPNTYRYKRFALWKIQSLKGKTFYTGKVQLKRQNYWANLHEYSVKRIDIRKPKYHLNIKSL